MRDGWKAIVGSGIRWAERMRRLNAALVITPLFALAGCSSPSIEGQWACPGATWNFESDGTFQRQVAYVQHSGQWRMDEDQLVIDISGSRLEPSEDQRDAVASLHTSTNPELAGELRALGSLTFANATTETYEVRSLEDESVDLVQSSFRGSAWSTGERPSAPVTRCLRGSPGAQDASHTESTPPPEADRSADVPPPTTSPEANEGVTGANPAIAEADSPAPAVRESCTYDAGPVRGMEVTVQRVCEGIGSLLESCQSFTVEFPFDGRVTHEDMGIKTIDGHLEFHPVELAYYEETIGGDVYSRWALSLVEWGGGAVAAKRYQMFDNGGQPLSPILDPDGLQRWIAERHVPDQALFFEGPQHTTPRCTTTPN